MLALPPMVILLTLILEIPKNSQFLLKIIFFVVFLIIDKNETQLLFLLSHNIDVKLGLGSKLGRL
jgi:hypothetical protein